MPQKYYKQKIDIILETDSELYKKITAFAKQEGETIESLVNFISSVGLYYHMEGNLQRHMKMYKEGKAK